MSDDDDETVVAMTKAIGVWAKRNKIRPVDLEDKMGWSYNYAWRILRGKDPFSKSAWGKFITVFGLATFQEIADIAKVDLSGIEEVPKK